MASTSASTVDEYLAELPPERAAVVRAVRDVILERLPAGYEETMNWGMISYQIPLSRYAQTYNGQPLGVLGLAAQKHHYAVYLNAVYTSAELEQRLRDGYTAAGTKLDFGKSCLRFRSLDAIELDVVGDIVASVTPDDYIAAYESSRAS